MSDEANAPAVGTSVPSSGGQGVSTPSSGQGVSPAPSIGGQGTDVTPSSSEGQVASNPFWKIKGDNGKEYVFQTPEELERHWRNGVMMQDRFTQKNQEFSSERKRFEQQRAEFEKKQAEIAKQAETIEQYRRMFKSRPEVRQALEQALKNPRGAGSSAVISEVERLVEERLSPYEQRISQFEQAEEERRQEALRNDVYGVMKNRYNDFNEEIIENSLKELSELPEDDPRARALKMAELMYFAHQGRRTPGERQRMMSDGPAPPPPPGPITNVEGQASYKDLGAAREAAAAEERRKRRRR